MLLEHNISLMVCLTIANKCWREGDKATHVTFLVHLYSYSSVLKIMTVVSAELTDHIYLSFINCRAMPTTPQCFHKEISV